MHHILCVIGVDCPQFISQSQVVGLVEQQRIPAALLHVHVRFITNETKIQLHVQVAFCLLLAGALSQFPKNWVPSFDYVNYWLIVFGCCGGV